jgi:hypothetical protein
MKSLAIRLVGIVAIGLLGFGLGQIAEAPADDNVPSAFAAYPRYEELNDLTEASDVVVRVLIEDAGTPFLDYGAPTKEDPTRKGDAIAMRLFSARVLGPDGSESVADQAIEIAVTDADVLGISGDAHLNKGDEVYLFLEELDNATFKLEEVKDGRFFVVVGGRQGVFRASADQWAQDADPHTVDEDDKDGGAASLPAFLIVAEQDLEAATKGL